MPYLPGKRRTDMPEGKSRYAALDVDVQLADVSVVIVNYNVCALLEQALRSVEAAAEGLAVEVFVVDNDSADGSVSMVRDKFPEVRVIANRENVGFSTANNQAIREATGRHLLILNPDTVLQEDTLRRLVAFMDAHPDAGAVGCRILNPDGTFAPESRRAFPTPAVAFYRISGLGRLFPNSPRFGRYNLTFLPRDEVCEVDALSGSCMLVRRTALFFARTDAESLRQRGHDPALCVPPLTSDMLQQASGAGLLDEAFFMYGEDLDWCYRLQQTGWRIYYTPDTQIIHYKGESTKKGELRYVRLFYGAMLRFMQKHFAGRYSSWFIRFIAVGIHLRAALSVVKRTGRGLALPLLEAGLTAGLLALAAAWRAYQTGTSPPPLFYAVVVPLGAALTILGVALAGGYRTLRRTAVGPAVTGPVVGFVGTVMVSFFAKDLAYSRWALPVGFGLALGALVLERGARALRRSERAAPRRVALVGPEEAEGRLEEVLAATPGAHVLVGRIGEGDALGPLRQLRDLVRLHSVDELVFATGAVPHHVVLDAMQALHDLPVQFKILPPEGAYLIGKASVDVGGSPLVEAEAAVGRPRSRAARRAFDAGVTVAGVVLAPLLGIAALAGWTPARRALSWLRETPAVLAGRKRLVGVAGDMPSPVVPVADALGVSGAGAEQARAHYRRRQSAVLDLHVLWTAARRPVPPSPLPEPDEYGREQKNGAARRI